MKLRNFLLGSLCFAASAVLGAGSASAAVTAYVGEDLIFTATPPATGAAPNSLAAANAFDAATGGSSLITFEGAPLGAISNTTVAPGVTINGSDFFGASQTIRNTTNFPSYPSVDGFNTTPSGSYFVEMVGGNLTFSFANPVQSFGAYLSGVQTNFYHDTLTFSDGSSQSIVLQGAGTSSQVGELAFIGFTDPGKAISSITVDAGTGSSFDAIGVDDVRFQGVAGVPEPATWAMMLVGFGGLGAIMRSRRRMAIVAA